MQPLDSRTIDYALTILDAVPCDGLGRPMTPCEKLACRVLLPVVGKRELISFCEWVESGNPLYRRRQLEDSLRVMRRLIDRAGGGQRASPPSPGPAG